MMTNDDQNNHTRPINWGQALLVVALLGAAIAFFALVGPVVKGWVEGWVEGRLPETELLQPVDHYRG